MYGFPDCDWDTNYPLDYCFRNQDVGEEDTQSSKNSIIYHENTINGRSFQFFNYDIASKSTEGSEILNSYQIQDQPNFVNIISPNTSTSSNSCTAQNIFGENHNGDNRVELLKITVEESVIQAQDQTNSEKEGLPSMKADCPNKTGYKQSIYKNKYKEALEQTKALLDEVIEKGVIQLLSAQAEGIKDDLVWRIEGEALSQKIQDYDNIEVDLEELQAKVQALKESVRRVKVIEKDEAKVASTIEALKKQGSKKADKKWEKQMEKALAEQSSVLQEKAILAQRLPQMKRDEKTLVKELKRLEGKLKPLRAEILKELSAKRYCHFLPIFEQMDQITQYVKKGDSMTFFDRYRGYRSMKYFESYMKDEELFYWILLLKVVLMFIPSDKDYLNLLPLNKSTSPFMLWLLESSVMKVKHKELFRESDVRMHLREKFKGVLDTLKAKAQKLFNETKWTHEKWNLTQQVINAGGETIETVAENSEKATTEEDAYKPGDIYKRTRDQYELNLNEFSLNEEISSTEKKIFHNY